MSFPKFIKELDLSLECSNTHEHPDIDLNKFYLVKFKDYWYLGQFYQEWYGLRFNNYGLTGMQYDKPGTNGSTWQRIIEIELD